MQNTYREIACSLMVAAVAVLAIEDDHVSLQSGKSTSQNYQVDAVLTIFTGPVPQSSENYAVEPIEPVSDDQGQWFVF